MFIVLQHGCISTYDGEFIMCMISFRIENTAIGVWVNGFGSQ